MTINDKYNHKLTSIEGNDTNYDKHQYYLGLNYKPQKKMLKNLKGVGIKVNNISERG